MKRFINKNYSKNLARLTLIKGINLKNHLIEKTSISLRMQKLSIYIAFTIDVFIYTIQ